MLSNYTPSPSSPFWLVQVPQATNLPKAFHDCPVHKAQAETLQTSHLAPPLHPASFTPGSAGSREEGTSPLSEPQVLSCRDLTRILSTTSQSLPLKYVPCTSSQKHGRIWKSKLIMDSVFLGYFGNTVVNTIDKSLLLWRFYSMKMDLQELCIL